MTDPSTDPSAPPPSYSPSPTPEAVRWVTDESLGAAGSEAELLAATDSRSPTANAATSAAVADATLSPATVSSPHSVGGITPGGGMRRLPGQPRRPEPEHALQLLDADAGASPAAPSPAPSPAALSPAEQEALEEQHHVQHERIMPVAAPRALLWKHLMNKVRHPELYTCAANVKILYEGEGVVYREMEAGEPGKLEHVKEKITWDEANGSVRADLYEDPLKDGYIENAISTNASGETLLHVTVCWRFAPSPALTPQRLALWRSGLKRAVDVGCAQTVQLVEQEALAAAQERRRRNSSLSAGKREKEEEQEKSKEHKEKEKEKQSAQQTASPDVHMRQIQVATKPPLDATASSSSPAAHDRD